MRDKISEQKVRKLAEMFKELRVAHGLSQAKLAHKVGISDRAISMIERHKRTPTILTCFKISRAFGRTLEDILKEI